MTDVKSPAVPAIVLRRTYNVPRARVYEAWTNPEIAARFLGPDSKARDITMDVRPGGTYSITMDSAEMGELTVTGVYRDVQPPHRLSMTWRWKEDDPSEEYDSLLTLEFHDNNGNTDFVLTHEQLATVESAESHKRGWTTITEQLAAIL